MKLGVIYARARNGVIGKGNAMPWHLPEDLAHFKQTTLGAPVLMGRKTWDSLPPKFRPLPGRRNIVITRQPDWHAQGAERAGTLEDAIALCGDVPAAWVTGGAEIYQLALPLASTAVVTEIEADFEGDAYAPRLGPHWQEVDRERHVSKNGLGYSFVTFHKRT
ncbi:MAG: folA [Ramlibacter sp.]|nr:folA [Ramlibacter sp.]